MSPSLGEWHCWGIAGRGEGGGCGWGDTLTGWGWGSGGLVLWGCHQLPLAFLVLFLSPSFAGAAAPSPLALRILYSWGAAPHLVPLIRLLWELRPCPLPTPVTAKPAALAGGDWRGGGQKGGDPPWGHGLCCQWGLAPPGAPTHGSTVLPAPHFTPHTPGHLPKQGLEQGRAPSSSPGDFAFSTECPRGGQSSSAPLVQ